MARRVGISLKRELHPATYIEGGEGYEKLSLELEATLRHMLDKILEAEKNYGS